MSGDRPDLYELGDALDRSDLPDEARRIVAAIARKCGFEGAAYQDAELLRAAHMSPTSRRVSWRARKIAVEGGWITCEKRGLFNWCALRRDYPRGSKTAPT